MGHQVPKERPCVLLERDHSKWGLERDHILNIWTLYEGIQPPLWWYTQHHSLLWSVPGKIVVIRGKWHHPSYQSNGDLRKSLRTVSQVKSEAWSTDHKPCRATVTGSNRHKGTVLTVNLLLTLLCSNHNVLWTSGANFIATQNLIRSGAEFLYVCYDTISEDERSLLMSAAVA